MTKKNKRPIYSVKKIKKSDDDITRVDQYTFYVKSCDPEKEPYFVYKSSNIGWCCDCMNFIMNLKDSNDTSTHECKHILRCKALG